MFSGIGGFEFGLQQSNHEFTNVGFSEIDKYAVSIYERHYPNHVNYGDATGINTEDLQDFELLVGGFPCQAFSLAGKRRGFDDTRGTLFFEIARVLKDKKPRYFLLENVKGILSHEGGATLQTIFGVCDKLGYDVSWAIYNSCDYGVPQNRERIFIKGYFREKCGGEVLHQSRNCKKTDGKLVKLNNKAQAQTVYDSDGLATTLSANGGGQGGKTGLYKVNHTDSAHPYYIKEEHKINKVGNVSPTGHHNGDVFSVNGIGRAICARDYKDAMKIALPVTPHNHKNQNPTGEEMKDKDNYVLECIGSTQKHASRTDGTESPTLTEAMGMGGGHVPMVKLNETDSTNNSDVPQETLIGDLNNGFRIRRLTPLECERLQGFPDGWTAFGKDGEKISDTQRYKCCGNAVTTTVITHIINEMFDQEHLN